MHGRNNRDGRYVPVGAFPRIITQTTKPSARNPSGDTNAVPAGEPEEEVHHVPANEVQVQTAVSSGDTVTETSNSDDMPHPTTIPTGAPCADEEGEFRIPGSPPPNEGGLLHSSIGFASIIDVDTTDHQRSMDISHSRNSRRGDLDRIGTHGHFLGTPTLPSHNPTPTPTILPTPSPVLNVICSYPDSNDFHTLPSPLPTQTNNSNDDIAYAGTCHSLPSTMQPPHTMDPETYQMPPYSPSVSGTKVEHSSIETHTASTAQPEDGAIEPSSPPIAGPGAASDVRIPVPIEPSIPAQQPSQASEHTEIDPVASDRLSISGRHPRPDSMGSRGPSRHSTPELTRQVSIPAQGPSIGRELSGADSGQSAFEPVPSLGASYPGTCQNPVRPTAHQNLPPRVDSKHGIASGPNVPPEEPQDSPSVIYEPLSHRKLDGQTDSLVWRGFHAKNKSRSSISSGISVPVAQEPRKARPSLHIDTASSPAVWPTVAQAIAAQQAQLHVESTSQGAVPLATRIPPISVVTTHIHSQPQTGPLPLQSSETIEATTQENAESASTAKNVSDVDRREVHPTNLSSSKQVQTGGAPAAASSLDDAGADRAETAPTSKVRRAEEGGTTSTQTICVEGQTGVNLKGKDQPSETSETASQIVVDAVQPNGNKAKSTAITPETTEPRKDKDFDADRKEKKEEETDDDEDEWDDSYDDESSEADEKYPESDSDSEEEPFRANTYDDDVVSEVERWTVKLPTRLEFKNVTVRVQKVLPKAKPAANPADPPSTTRGDPDLDDGTMKEFDDVLGLEEEAQEDFEASANNDSLCAALSWMLPGSNEGEKITQVVLDNISGSIEPGKMVAIMGASGAGKTTLLSALSGRIKLKPPQNGGNQHRSNATTRSVSGGDVDDLEDYEDPAPSTDDNPDDSKPVSHGGIYFNGTRMTEEELGSMTGYVMQDDVLLGTLTPRETLQFAANMQLPPNMPLEKKYKRCEKILKQLDILKCADSPIGTPNMRGISGGERRRVSIAVEMIRNPSVLFLDEPTSGLDSTTAVKVMRVLKNLARTGRTVIFTIHSPNAKILALFDTLILLSRGKIGYFGPANRALAYFKSLGYRCPDSANPAEFFLNVLQMNTVDMLASSANLSTLKEESDDDAEDAKTYTQNIEARRQRKKSDKLGIEYKRDDSVTYDGDYSDPHSRGSCASALSSASAAVSSAMSIATSVPQLLEPDVKEKKRRKCSAPDGEHEHRKRVREHEKKIREERRKKRKRHDPMELPPDLQAGLALYKQYQDGKLQNDKKDGTGPPQVRFKDLERLVAEFEDKRLSAITDRYLQDPVRRDERYSPFLQQYVPRLRKGILRLNEDEDGGSGGSNRPATGGPQIPLVYQLKYLSQRTYTHVIRQPMNTILRVLVNVFLSIFVGILFYQTGNSQASIFARVGFLFFMSSIQAFITVVSAVLTFTEERALFLREKQKNLYTTSAYFVGRTLIDIGLQTILAFVFGMFAYPMVGLQGSGKKFFQFIFCLVLIGQATHSYALIVGALVPFRTVALMLSPMVMVPFMMVTGFFANNKSMPEWMEFVRAVSPQKYMFEALMATEFDGLALECKPHEYIALPVAMGVVNYCPFTDGHTILNLFRMPHGDARYWWNVGMVFIVMIVVRFVAYGALRFSAWRHLNSSSM